MDNLQRQLAKYFEERPYQWIHKSDIMDHRFSTKKGGKYQADSISRTLCKMEANCRIAVKTEKNGRTFYHYLAPDKRMKYLRKDERPTPTTFFRTV